MTDERRELIRQRVKEAVERDKALLDRLAFEGPEDIPRYEIHMIRRCVMCNQDAVTNKQGFCPRCAKDNP